MKQLLLILLLGWNVCVGQIYIDSSTHVMYVDSVWLGGYQTRNNKTYGYIQFIADTTKEINFTIYIKGYSIDYTHNVPGYCIGCVYKTDYFDLKGKQLFVQRFKKGKFLNFYQ